MSYCSEEEEGGEKLKVEYGCIGMECEMDTCFVYLAFYRKTKRMASEGAAAAVEQQ